MVHIRVKKGLDIPIDGAPERNDTTLIIGTFAYDLTPFNHRPLRLMVEEGDVVEAGHVLCEDKDFPDFCFTVPIHGKVLSIVRGEKRRLQKIIIEPLSQNSFVKPVSLESPTLFQDLLQSGLVARFRKRPFGGSVDPKGKPRAIFIQGLESAPFMPSSEMQVEGRNDAFLQGLKVLQKLTPGNVHLVVKKGSALEKEYEGVFCHTVEGPHPSSSPSLHIQKIDPIRSEKDTIWTLTLLDVIALGEYILHGNLLTPSVIAASGGGIAPQDRRFVRAIPGIKIDKLLSSFPEDVRYISGDPLTGEEIEKDSFLRMRDTVLSVLPEAPAKRSFLPFMRFLSPAYTATRAYVLRKKPFTTALLGDERPFVDSALYEKVLPFDILPMLLLKALVVGDVDRAIEYGALQIVPEDFALASFVCPSKNDCIGIVREGLKSYNENGSV